MTHWGFPQVVGAIDDSHIHIIRPSESATDYYNRKCLLLVDYQGQFIKAYIGWPHNARVFYHIQDILFPQQPANIEGIDVPLLVLRDPILPCMANETLP